MARSQAEQVAGVQVFSSQQGAETIPAKTVNEGRPDALTLLPSPWRERALAAWQPPPDEKCNVVSMLK
jgi:hypothetical protein